MEDLVQVIKTFDDEKKKKLFFDLSSANTVANVMNVCANYNLSVTNEQAKELFEGFKNSNKLTKEELAGVSGGIKVVEYFPPPIGMACSFS